jgi:GDP-4-dehydro-6-deoxy-D-mannose reductase
MKLFVTGVGGFVGRRLARLASAAGQQVSGLFIEEAPDLPGVELYEGDILDREALAKALRSARPEAVIHLAGLSHVGESWRRLAETFQVNVLGTENVLAAAPESTRVVVASSAEVYGIVPEEEQPIGEERMPAPGSPYALTKAAAERLALGRGAVVSRSFNQIGPGQARQFALPAFASQLAAIARGDTEPVLAVGNLEPRRDFLHVDDGAEALLLLAHQGEPGKAYNICRGRSWSMAEVLERLMEISGVRARLRTDPARVRAVDVPVLTGDPRRLEALGWSPRRSLDDALRDLWQEVSACSMVVESGRNHDEPARRRG